MKSIWKSLVLVTLLGSSPLIHADDKGTAPEAVALVQKVIASIKANGRQKTIDDVNAKKYVDRDLSVTIITMEGITLANLNAKLVGKNVLEIKDSNGKAFVRDGIEAVKKHGHAWIDFQWPHPLTQKIEAKSTYSERVEDLVISCGTYKTR